MNPQAPFNGVLWVDKPKGMTSHDVVAKLRRAFNTRRIGHAGTLDPDATGLLTILVGRATKLSEQLMKADKVYRVSFQLGVETTTYDSTGEVVATKCASHITREQVEETLKEFLGPQEQRPPMYSAVKFKGKKLYQLARKGIQIEVEPKKIEVFRLDLLSFDPTASQGELDMECTKGTYVRSIIHDIGKKLGSGAMTTAIRRTKSGEISVDRAIPLDQIVNATDPVSWVEDKILRV
jgi:tRNA pseudouridine55 synthase